MSVASLQHRSLPASNGKIASESKPAAVVWLYGRPSAGKTTSALALKAKLDELDCPNCILDGDELRRGVCRDLGFTAEERTENLRRTAEIAKLLSKSDVVTIVACITPLIEQREMASSIIGRDIVHFFYMAADLHTCMQRDAKGLYAKALKGELPGLTGVDSSFEPPTSQSGDITIDCDCLPKQFAELAATICCRPLDAAKNEPPLEARS